MYVALSVVGMAAVGVPTVVAWALPTGSSGTGTGDADEDQLRRANAVAKVRKSMLMGSEGGVAMCCATEESIRASGMFVVKRMRAALWGSLIQHQR